MAFLNDLDVKRSISNCEVHPKATIPEGSRMGKLVQYEDEKVATESTSNPQLL